MASAPPDRPVSAFVAALRAMPTTAELGRKSGAAADASKSGPPSLVASRMNALLWRQRFAAQTEFHCVCQVPGAEDGGTRGVEVHINQQLGGESSGLGTGACVWPAAQVLMGFLERACAEGAPPFVAKGGLRGKRVADLGSGTGVVGIGAALLGAEATVCDQEQLLALLQENVELNAGAIAGCGGSCRVMEHSWGVDDGNLDPPLDFVLVSDCVLPKLYPIEPLVAAIDALCGERTVALLSYERRHYPLFDPRERFEALCAARGLSLAEVPAQQHHRVFQTEDIELWAVRRTAPSSAAAAAPPAPPTALRVVQWGGQGEGEAVFGNTSPTYGGDVLLDGAFGELKLAQRSEVGATAWIGSVVLSRYMLGLAAAGVVPPRSRVLELGSGIGLAAAVLSRPPVRAAVTATDLEPALALLRENLAANGCGDAVAVAALDWRDAAAGGEAALGLLASEAWDIVVAADCIYDHSAVEPLVAALRAACPAPAAGLHSPQRVIIANAERSAIDQFRRAAEKDFEIVNVSISENLSRVECWNGYPAGVRLLELRRRSA